MRLPGRIFLHRRIAAAAHDFQSVFSGMGGENGTKPKVLVLFRFWLTVRHEQAKAVKIQKSGCRHFFDALSLPARQAFLRKRSVKNEESAGRT